MATADASGSEGSDISVDDVPLWDFSDTDEEADTMEDEINRIDPLGDVLPNMFAEDSDDEEEFFGFQESWNLTAEEFFPKTSEAMQHGWWQ